MGIDESTLNAEISWAFKIFKSHVPFRSYIDLSKLFLLKLQQNSLLGE